MCRTPLKPKVGNTYCVSDLHIHPQYDGRFDRLFTLAKADVLRSLARTVASGDGRGRLVLAGDVFDLTGMRPPEFGLDEFFTAILGLRHSIPIPKPERPADYLKRISDSYPRLMAELGDLTRNNDLVILEGNHDHALSNPETKRALASLMGTHEDHISIVHECRVGQYHITHGHQYDDSCRITDDSPNRGAVIASALYHAVMPALLALDLPLEVVSAIPAVRPEERIVEGLQNHLDAGQCRLFLKAFVKLLVANGYWPEVPPFIRDVVGGAAAAIITPDNVRRQLADDTANPDFLRMNAYWLLLSERQDPEGCRISVMGHTHDIDARAADYVNLGTWIDAVDGLTNEAVGEARCKLPVLRICPDDNAVLFDARGLLQRDSLDACPRLWTSPSALPKLTIPWQPDLLDPTVSDTDVDGYSYVETSPRWKETCRAFPCFAAIKWPGYDTKVIEAKIDGKPIVIQLWKGWCQQFMGLTNFPGGVGVEVGIYRRIPNKQLPEDLTFASPFYRRLLEQIAKVGGDIWWPYPEFEAELELTVVNPAADNKVLFRAGPQQSYWLNRWMSLGSYSRYKSGNPTPPLSTGYRLDFTVNGQGWSW